jgi:hypothetical protein
MTSTAQYRAHGMMPNAYYFDKFITEALQCRRFATMDAIGGRDYWRREAAAAEATAIGFSSI